MDTISLKNITKKFGNKVIFKNFNLNIKKGDFVSIMGPSGTGKSTLLNIIGLLESKDSGYIKILDYLNPKFNSKEGVYLLRKEISYLFQNYGLVENKTVNYNLKMATHFLKLSKNEENKKIKDALSKVGLENIENEKVYSLSGGEQQRVALAKIILKPSSIILADEPTGSLDEKNRDIVLKILKKFNEDGKTIIVVTHDPIVGEVATTKIKL
ncbi:putative bacteriocin export ABC transporter [Clostridium botulinum C]|uniref:ATP-binding cassette domain-containing protein n=2 Tax=Clostridium botulinum TaxID=1491 RepID=A0A9Q4TNF2_CLOBO|nr:putative bacteriocin export ABC transporter [Clostridium botulinum]EGO88877.1 bacteriocin ABC transporter ATP-binding protein [Clostridium botulinum C str. Stockholm]MCD3195323.1 putative bacteriocin export ABC transporter [Clostridium botulinum C]MCD3200661.1 putative bacteriocin export ABC transporter [Clostridium botulinum C]MCD3206069.1 putative bacteriocin export ABC transporter [Clostridium botulinum C]MCD3208454.1 putative bacteriocin export ABC transporter [Clostridium botulinum C]